jgi:CheY-like chemotaxis protein
VATDSGGEHVRRASGNCGTLIAGSTADPGVEELDVESVQRRLSVLVVDDDHGLRESLLEALNDAGYDAEGIGDGQSAIARLSQLPVPNLVVLDLLLPHVNGWEVLARLRATERLSKIPVIVVSGEGTRLGETVGANALLPKPFALRALLELLERFSARP